MTIENKIKVQEAKKLLMKKQTELAVVEAAREGIVLEISETKPGRFRIVRDYSKESESNKKLNRLMRD